jgi:hypothetical protein
VRKAYTHSHRRKRFDDLKSEAKFQIGTDASAFRPSFPESQPTIKEPPPLADEERRMFPVGVHDELF